MTTTLLLILSIPLLASVPDWLPGLVARLRNYVFARINGQQVLTLPDPELGGAAGFTRLYGDSRAGGRSRGAKLSDLFWYWLSPGAHMHQEHLENGPRYQRIARLSRELLSRPHQEIEVLVRDCLRTSLEIPAEPGSHFLRLRDLMMPVWADFFHRLVFKVPASPDVRQMIVAHARDLANALKCCGLRHMEVRLRLTQYVQQQIRAGELPFEFPPGFSVEEQAYYLQGTFFTTGVVQMSDAASHVLLAMARHQEIQTQLAKYPEDRSFQNMVVAETLRLYPLFGISHRITTGDIPLGEGRTLPKGSVVCFDHQAFQRLDWDRPHDFLPERWRHVAKQEVNYIPFGVASNRPCPARGIALAALRCVASEVLREYRLESSASHTRAIPNRGPCLLTRREEPQRAGRLKLRWLWLRDRWENVARSFLQLVLGTYMVLDARRAGLCRRQTETSQ